MIVTLETMGTVASIDVRDADLGEPDIVAIREVLDGFESRFSLYREGSELSRVARGELPLTDASEELRTVYGAALEWRTATSGAFTPHRPDGVIDVNGIVKAIAIQEMGAALAARGFENWCLNVGGDVLTSGSTVDVLPWTVGIVDPMDRSGLLCAFELREGRTAVATSGIAERGEHIWRTETESEGSYVQVSVSADDIVTADVLATAILSGGESFRDMATERWDIDVLTVARSGELSATPGIPRAFAGRV